MKQKIFSRRTKRKVLKNIALNRFMNLTSKEPFLSWAYIYMTRKCNLDCSYCYTTESEFKKMGIPGASNDMSIEELRKCVDKLHSLGTRYVSFFGGEPTLRRDDLVEIVRYSSIDKGMFTQLPTNGTLLKQDGYIDELGRAEIDVIDVSLDSLGRFEDSGKDIYHRKSLFTSLIEGRKKHGFAIKTNYVITKKNVNQLEPILEFGHQNEFMVSIRLAMRPPILPVNWEEQEGIYLSPTTEDIEIVDGIVDRVLQKHRQGHAITEPVEYYEAMKQYVRGEKNFWKCEAGTNHLTINNDGMVMQCALLIDNLGLHFSELDKDYAETFKDKVRDNLAECNDNCLSAAYFCGQYYGKRLDAFLDKVKDF